MKGLIQKIFGRRDRHFRELVRGASLAFVMKVSGAALAFLFNWLLARTLGAEGTGLFFLALTVGTIASVCGRMGMENTLLRFVAAGAAQADWGRVKGVHRKGVMIALGAGTLATILMLLLAPVLAEVVFQDPLLTRPTQLMALSVVPSTLMVLYGESLKGLKRMLAGSFVQQSQGAGLFGLACLGVVLLGREASVGAVVGVYAGATAVMAALGLVLWHQATPQLRGIAGYFDTRQLLQTSLPLFWVAALHLLMNWVGTFALGIWATSADVGLFNVAYRIALLPTFVLFATNSIAAPKFAALYEQEDYKGLAATLHHSTRMMILAALPLLLPCLVAPGWIMGLFGPEFSGGRWVLLVLVIGQFINVATGSVTKLLMMTGHERSVRDIITVTAVLNVVLNVVLVPRYGVLGAALASAICLVTQNVQASYWVYRRFKLLVLPVPGLARMQDVRN